jgi:hypothetical protein
MNEREIDAILKRAAESAGDVDPALLARIAKSLGSSMTPVRVLPPFRALASVLVLLSASIAIAGAMVSGPHGFQKMSAYEAAVIFPVLGLLTIVAAAASVAEVIPGSRRLLPAWLAGGSGIAVLAAVFGLLFHDYGSERFVPQGLACLAAGLGYAAPAFVATWWVLSRGFAVNPIAAGFTKGALAGLAGVGMLELHCVNFEVPHFLVWHIAVIPIAAAAGALTGNLARRRRLT